MDSVQSLALLVLLAPLVAAGAIALSALLQARRLARLIAMGGAAISFVAASAALVRLLNGGTDGEASLNLGVWLSSGARDPFQLAFPIAVDVPAVLLAAITSLCTLCALAATRTRLSDGASERLVSMGASLLLSSSLGIVLSENVGELFVLWQIASFSSYLMLSATAETGPEAAAAKKFMVMQRCAEFWLLCAVLAFAVAYRTLDYDDLIGYLRYQGGSRFALVHFIGLCLLAAGAARCALFPFLGWIDGLAAGPAVATLLVEGTCLMPAGVLLLIRFLPALHAATAASAFAVFLGGASAFFAAICAWCENDPRRQAGFACASIFGFVVLGLSLPGQAAAAWGIVLTVVFIPTSTVLLGWSAQWRRTGVESRPYEISGTHAPLTTGAVAVSIVVLLSGICGQGGILAAALGALSKGAVQGGATLALTVVLALGAQFFAALAMTRALLTRTTAIEVAVPGFVSVSKVDSPEDDSKFFANLSSWPMVVLAACGIVIGLAGGALTLAGRTNAPTSAAMPTLAGGTIVATLLGCLPALAGFFAGWRRPRRAPDNRELRTTGDLLTRLGRKRFYCDAFLLSLVVLPTRGLAQMVRFIDWFVVDGFVSGAPISAVESAGAVLEPVEGRSVFFYLVSAAVGTALLGAVVVSLRY
jgi:NADH:ubiquinone oxidoreductase subunit 5 (subunit L)/multisubunit Na+/H+ antiporter MnhA subunit